MVIRTLFKINQQNYFKQIRNLSNKFSNREETNSNFTLKTYRVKFYQNIIFDIKERVSNQFKSKNSITILNIYYFTVIFVTFSRKIFFKKIFIFLLIRDICEKFR